MKLPRPSNYQAPDALVVAGAEHGKVELRTHIGIRERVLFGRARRGKGLCDLKSLSLTASFGHRQEPGVQKSHTRTSYRGPSV